MSASKDGKLWRCQFYYKDWQGIRKKKNKRGFRTKSEAEQWERDFLQQHSGDLSVKFGNFVEKYMEDEKPKDIPPKPKKPKEVETFEQLKPGFDQMKKHYGKIRRNEDTIDALKSAIETCTPFFGYFEKRDYQKSIEELESKNRNEHSAEKHIAMQYGFPDVDSFMKTFNHAKKVNEAYVKKLSDWNDKYGDCAESEIKPRKSLQEQLDEAKKRVEEQKQNHKEKKISKSRGMSIE